MSANKILITGRAHYCQLIECIFEIYAMKVLSLKMYDLYHLKYAIQMYLYINTLRAFY